MTWNGVDYVESGSKVELGEPVSLPSAMKGAVCEVCGELTVNFAIAKSLDELPDVPAPRYCQKCGHRLGVDA